MQKTINESDTTKLVHSDLWREYWRNPDSGEALSRLVEVLLPLVHKVFERVSISLPSHIATEDLMQVALMGLYHAINRFDPRQGFSFEAFAYPRLRGAILDELRAMDHVSRSSRSQIRRVEQFIGQWMIDHGKSPDEAELSEGLGLQAGELAVLLERAQPRLSLDEIVDGGDGAGLTLMEILVDPKVPSPDAEAQREDLRRHLRKTFRCLTSREQKILYLYYYEDLRLSEIALLYELSEARICQIHALAITKLRVAMSRVEKR
jgi:RNA polymerase sigma factor for flagellar operon FliA